MTTFSMPAAFRTAQPPKLLLRRVRWYSALTPTRTCTSSRSWTTWAGCWTPESSRPPRLATSNFSAGTRQFGDVLRAGVECTGSYGAGLARYLATQRVPVVEVNQPDRSARRRRGKTDAVDAESADRTAPRPC